MTEPDEMTILMEQIDKANTEMRRLKKAERMQILRSPGMSTKNIESAIDYWRGRKEEAESRMRLLQ